MPKLVVDLYLSNQFEELGPYATYGAHEVCGELGLVDSDFIAAYGATESVLFLAHVLSFRINVNFSILPIDLLFSSRAMSRC